MASMASQAALNYILDAPKNIFSVCPIYHATIEVKRPIIEAFYIVAQEEIKIKIKNYWYPNTSTGKLMLTMIVAIYELERANMLERQREEIAIAKGKGANKGRKEIKKPANWSEVYPRWQNREHGYGITGR